MLRAEVTELRLLKQKVADLEEHLKKVARDVNEETEFNKKIFK